MASPQQQKRVLIVDGGGFRGLGALHIINHFTKAGGRDQKPCEMFDMMCGSSVGGLIAILLGHLRLDCTTAIMIYKKLTERFCGTDETQFYDKLLEKDFLETKEFDITLREIIEQHGGHADLPMISEGIQGTKTFVTVVAGEPDYSNQTHLIRSYPTPTGSTGSISPPVKHIWLVREAVRATLSSPIYMPPVKIESMYGFSDAGFAGFNNPVERARKECKTLWPTDNLDTFVFVSIGTGLASLSESEMTRPSIVERHAAPLAKSMMEKIPADLHTRGKKEKALAISRHLSAIALDTQDAHEGHYKLSLQSEAKANYYRLDPALDLAEADLCDCFHQGNVERAVNKWADGPGKALISKIAEKIATLVIAPRDMEPPKPKIGTVNPGYNPQLDKKRPSTMVEYLRFYHVLFIVDNSKSMLKQNKWNETREALVGIAKYAFDHESGEIELIFLHSSDKTAGIQVTGGESILTLFNGAKLERGTPTGKVLKKVLDEHVTKLDEAIGKPSYAMIRPLDIIVLTDGRPDKSPAIEDVLAATVKKMKDSKHHANSIGVQFVQIGDDQKAKKALVKLVYGENGHMVDTVIYTEKLTSQRLERILLGGLHPNIRLKYIMPLRHGRMSTESLDTFSIRDGGDSDSE